jgi:hypothetical protein
MAIEQEGDTYVVTKYSVLFFYLRCFILATQSSLGKISLLNRSTICKTEAKMRRLRVTNLQRIVSGIGLTCEDFFHIFDNDLLMQELIDIKQKNLPTTLMEVRESIDQLIKDSEDDFTSMKLLISHKKNAHALIFLNKHIRDLLHALFVKVHQVKTPLVPNNLYLLKAINPAKAVEQENFLGLLKNSLSLRDISNEIFNQLIKEASNLRKWIHLQLKEPFMKPPKVKYLRTAKRVT